MVKNLRNYSVKILLLFILLFAGLFYMVKNRPFTSRPRSIDMSDYVSIAILGEDIYKLNSAGNADALLFSLEDFSKEFVVKFSSLIIAPDGDKFCFLGQLVDGRQNLYIASLSTTGFNKLGLAQNCIWSPNSNMIAYNNYASAKDPIDVFVYDVKSKKTIDLTRSQANIDTAREYGVPTWETDKTLRVTFKEFTTRNGVLRNSGEELLKVD